MNEDGSSPNQHKKRVRQDIVIARVVGFLMVAASVAVSLVLELKDNTTELVLSLAIIIFGLSVALILVLLAQTYEAIEKLSNSRDG